MKHTTEQITQQAVKGSEQAFVQLFEEYFRAVYNYALSLSGDPAVADDLTQDAFIKAHANVHHLSAPWKFRPWIFRITRNLYIDQFRVRRDLVSLEDEGIDMGKKEPGIEDLQIQQEDFERVRNTLQLLPIRYREALILREFHDFSYTEISDIMDISLQNTKVVLHRARAKFQEAYGVNLLVEESTPECATLHELLSAVHDNEAQSNQIDFVQKHVKNCPSCQERQQSLIKLSRMLALIPPIVPPSWIAKRILKQIQKPIISEVTALKEEQMSEPILRSKKYFYLITGFLIVFAFGGYKYSVFRAIAGNPPIDSSASQVSLSYQSFAAETQVGIPIELEAIAIGPEPFISMELWVNGELSSVQASTSAGQSPLQRSFTWLPTEPGNYVLTAVAIKEDQNIYSPPLFLPIGMTDSDNDVVVEIGSSNRIMPDSSSTDEATDDSSMTPVKLEENLIPAKDLKPDLLKWVTNPLQNGALIAPSLSYELDSCNITLNIHDSSDNEDGFMVYRSSSNSRYWHRIATLEPNSGGDWVIYPAGSVSGEVSYYVSAFNLDNETASNQIIVITDPSICPKPESDKEYLSIKLESIFATPMPEKAYCYFSFGNDQWSRWPTTGFFLPSSDGYKFKNESKNLLVNGINGSSLTEKLDLTMDCWGWVGGEITSLGVFTHPLDPQEPSNPKFSSPIFYPVLDINLSDASDLPSFYPIGGGINPVESNYKVPELLHPGVPRVNAFITHDPEICSGYLPPDAQNLLGTLLYCFPYDGYTAGKDSANPQPYLAWAFTGDPVCVGGIDPDICHDYAYWKKYAADNNGVVGFSINDNSLTGSETWVVTDPDQTVFTLPPISCLGTRTFTIQMWVKVGEETFYGPHSNHPTLSCPPAKAYDLNTTAEIEISLSTLNMTDIDDGGAPNLEVYGYLHAITSSGSSQYLKIGSWNAQASHCVDDTFDSSIGGLLGSSCPALINEGTTFFNQINTCVSSQKEDCDINGFAKDNATIRVFAAEGDRLTLTFHLMDWDDLSANDIVCNTGMFTAVRTLDEWKATFQEGFTISNGDLSSGACSVTGVFTAIP